MSRTFQIAAIFFPAALAFASCSSANSGDSAAQSTSEATPAADPAPFAISEKGSFDEPWAMAFEPGTDNLFITERKGALKIYHADGHVSSVSGVPKVDYGGQGGFGDIAFAPDYSTSRAIYLSWAEAGDNDTRGAVVGRGKLVCSDKDNCRIDGLTVIWRQTPKVTGRGHFSHRLAFSPDGAYLYVASGERQKFDPAQDLTNNLGKVLRLLPDGTPAPGNPFAGKGGQNAEIWSYGHRNILGLKFDASGNLWDLEHGPAGGDELNLVKRGTNYGWPVVSNGDNYDGTPIPRHPTHPEFEAPAISWNPVIAPGDFIFYSGSLFPALQGDALLTGLKTQALIHLKFDGSAVREVARYDFGTRLREIEQGPDGAIWVATDGPDAKLLKLTPKG